MGKGVRGPLTNGSLCPPSDQVALLCLTAVWGLAEAACQPPPWLPVTPPCRVGFWGRYPAQPLAGAAASGGLLRCSRAVHMRVHAGTLSRARFFPPRLVQSRQQQQNVEDAIKEMQKPLARYIDDEDLDRMLREQEREGDPMASFIKKTKAKESKDKKGEPLGVVGREGRGGRVGLWGGGAPLRARKVSLQPETPCIRGLGPSSAKSSAYRSPAAVRLQSDACGSLTCLLFPH